MSIAEISQPSVLADLILGQFFTDDKPSSQSEAEELAKLQKVAALSERILELDPTMTEVAKYSAFSKIEEAYSERDHHPTSDAEAQLWAQADASIDRAQKLNPNAADLEEAKLLTGSDGLRDLQKLETLANDLIDRSPNSPLGYYYMAQFNWKNQNREAAIELTSIAQQLHPEDKRYAETLEFLRENPLGTSGAFTNRIAISVTGG